MLVVRIADSYSSWSQALTRDCEFSYCLDISVQAPKYIATAPFTCPNTSTSTGSVLLHLRVYFPRKYNSTPPVYSHFTFPREIIAFTVRPVCIRGFPGLLDPSTAEIMCFKLYVGVIGVWGRRRTCLRGNELELSAFSSQNMAKQVMWGLSTVV